MLIMTDRRGAGERGPPREYDLYGNLLSVALPDGRTIEYDVDGAGRRVGRRVLSSTGVELEYRGWIYRDLLRPIAEVDALGNVVARYIYADGEGAKQNGVSQLSTRLGANQDTSLPFAGDNVPEIIELLSGGAVTQRLRLIKDQVGTVELVTDVSTGEIVQRIEHDEFGRVLFDSDPGLQPFGFAGGLYDAETGLVRFGARDYDPAIGRWTARDPVRLGSERQNLFSYSQSAPVGRTDVAGLRDWGPLGGRCCNSSTKTEFGLIGDGKVAPIDLAWFMYWCISRLRRHDLRWWILQGSQSATGNVRRPGQ